MTVHGEAIGLELAWLQQVIDGRLRHFFDAEAATPFTVPAPPVLPDGSALAAALVDLGPEARIALALALAAQISTATLDPLLIKNTALDRPFTEFGLRLGTSGDTPRPTLATALFLTAGQDLSAQLEHLPMFDPLEPLRLNTGLELQAAASDGRGEFMYSLLDIPHMALMRLCQGQPPRPGFTSEFPAARLTTHMQWDDLVLPPALMDQLDHITAWLDHGCEIATDWGLHRRAPSGFKALFAGPPGTGKSLTAALLGKRTGREVYRVDLSMTVSKYIGETEKNLARIFDTADHQDWILFFDEADALFGARTGGTSSHDRAANANVAYLLQRIEASPSLIILATNLRANMDAAFFRRFQLSLQFQRPQAEQRLQLWQDTLRDAPLLEPEGLKLLAQDFDLSGAAIANAAQFAAIRARAQHRDVLTITDLRFAATKELAKEGRVA